MEIDFFFVVYRLMAIRVPSTYSFRLYSTGNRFHGGKDNVAGTAWLRRAGSRSEILYPFSVTELKIQGWESTNEIRVRLHFAQKVKSVGSHGKRNPPFGRVSRGDRRAEKKNWALSELPSIAEKERFCETITVDFVKIATYQQFRHVSTRLQGSQTVIGIPRLLGGPP